MQRQRERGLKGKGAVAGGISQMEIPYLNANSVFVTTTVTSTTTSHLT
jgi:hypothetical protein